MNESSGSIKCGEFVIEQGRCLVRKGDALRGGGFVSSTVIVLCDQDRLSLPGAVSTRVWVLRLEATSYTISESTGSDYIGRVK
jgi:hypothetical protein